MLGFSAASEAIHLLGLSKLTVSTPRATRRKRNANARPGVVSILQLSLCGINDGCRAGETDVQHDARIAAQAERQREARCGICIAIVVVVVVVVWY